MSQIVNEMGPLPAAKLRAAMEADIAAGRVASGGRLPSERSLSDQHGMHRITVQKALGQLEAEGMIYRQDRSGWYVSPPRFLYDPAADVSFTENAVRQGRTPGSVLLLAEETVAGDATAAALDVPHGAPVTRLRRVRTLEDRPAFVEESHVSSACCPGLAEHAATVVSLAALYRDRFGITLRRRWVRMHLAALRREEASHLRSAPGAPGLLLTRLSCDAHDRPVSYDREYWRHDALELVVQVAAGGPATAQRHQVVTRLD